MVLVDSIVNACIEQYKKLSKTGKPSFNEWTVISSIVSVSNDEDIKVLSLGTGSKCIGQSVMSPNGDILNDSHAEVIARRAFVKFLFLQIIQFNTTGFSEVFVKDSDGFQVKDCVKFYFVTSMPPCGDASIMPKDPPQNENTLKRPHSPEDDHSKKIKAKNRDLESDSINLENDSCNTEKKPKPDIHRTGAKCLPASNIQDPHLPGALYHTVGAVRTKPGRGDPTLSLSCSDKIARWNAIGWQGALLSLFIKTPIFMTAIICGGGCPFSKESFDRSVNVRTDRKPFIPIHQSTVTFPDVKTDEKKPNPSSIIWCDGKDAEVSINGRKIGVTKKNLHKKTARVSICKKELFLLFEKAVNTLPNKEAFIERLIGGSEGRNLNDVTYAEVKSKAENYRTQWNYYKNEYFKVWSEKPVGLLDFTLKDEE